MTDLNSYEFTRKENTAFYFALVATGAVLSLMLYRTPVLSLIPLIFASRIKEQLALYLAERRKREYLAEFKDFLFMISTAIGAGRAMKDSIGEAIPSLKDTYGEKSLLAGELTKAYTRMENGNEDDVSVLMDLATASSLEDVIDFVTVYSTCKKTGASLITALNKAAGMIIDKMTIEKEIRELVRRKELEGSLIFIMPFAVILFLNITSPDYIAPLYDTAAGKVIMTSLIVVNAGVFAMIRKIVRVEI
jgi:tight adherence protein B